MQRTSREIYQSERSLFDSLKIFGSGASAGFPRKGSRGANPSSGNGGEPWRDVSQKYPPGTPAVESAEAPEPPAGRKVVQRSTLLKNAGEFKGRDPC